MKNWQPIKTAVMDGTRLRLQRRFQGHPIAEGVGFFGAVTIDYDAQSGGPQTVKDVWVDQDQQHLFPTPTHWKPAVSEGKA